MALKYKVGDRVLIKSLDWYNENKTSESCLVCGPSHINSEMICMLGKIATISSIEGDHYRIKEHGWNWTDEMIENKVEETKTKFKVGDEVRLKGTDIGGVIESIIRGQLIVNSKGSKIPAWPEDVAFIKGFVEEENINNKWNGLKVELELSKSIIGVSNIESLHGERFMSGFVKAIIPPEGYIFKDENGNIINTTKIVLEKKKPKYPKTYEECIDILGGASIIDINTYYYGQQLKALYKLIICRDAYWKIAGEEMGLDKPWELSIGIPIYYIYYNRTLSTIRKDYADDVQGNVILAFPTEEMRDAFYENFKKELEICKELL